MNHVVWFWGLLALAIYLSTVVAVPARGGNSAAPTKYESVDSNLPTDVSVAPLLHGFAGSEALSQADAAVRRLAKYRNEMSAFRQEFGGTFELPDVSFFLFGMGSRTKLLYKSGVLVNSVTGKTLRQWQVQSEFIIPPEYTVVLITKKGQWVGLVEDELGVWIEENGQRRPVANTQNHVHLPAFEGHRYPQVLRVLHQELLVNVIGGNPVPNYFVYPKPWYRDGAMMAMCFKATGNLHLIKDWVLSLREPYDRNNAGETEADNLGQSLYLISLVCDRSHPLVPKILSELPRFEVDGVEGKYIKAHSFSSAAPCRSSSC